MGLVTGDLLQLTLFGQYYGEQTLNVFYYRYVPIAPATNDTYPAIIDWFEDHILAQLLPMVSVQWGVTGFEVRNLSNGVDFYTRPVVFGTVQGSVTGDGLPSYVTYGWRLVRESLVTRNGYKRFSGVAESQGVGNGYTPPTANINNMNTELAADIVIGLVTIAEPIIVKRPIPAPGEAYQYSSIGSADFRGIGSQNTRKPGRGI